MGAKDAIVFGLTSWIIGAVVLGVGVVLLDHSEGLALIWSSAVIDRKSVV